MASKDAFPAVTTEFHARDVAGYGLLSLCNGHRFVDAGSAT
ncbi:MAG: hypothetical protein WA900_04415 [Casimicrobiaceae bacterium]